MNDGGQAGIVGVHGTARRGEDGDGARSGVEAVMQVTGLADSEEERRAGGRAGMVVGTQAGRGRGGPS